ncbi:hypothetical protein Tco_0369509 [Tanacetum coccineum]
MLPNDEIFEGMGQMGYPTDGTFTFWKSFFTPQWRYLVHHLLHCISSKSGGWDQFGSNIATALICLSTGRVYNFSKLIFDGMVANLKSKTKFLMYPRFLQLILDIQTENKHPYLAVTLTKKIFGNMKRGFRGAPRPLLPAMLLVATTNPSAGQEHPDVAQSQPPSSTLPVPSTSSPPVQSPPLTTAPIPASTPTPIPETEPEPIEHTFEEPSPAHHHFSPPQEHAQGQMTVDDLLQVVPQLMSRIDSLEKDLKQTKLTMGSAIVKLVKKVKKLEGILKRRNVVLSDSEEEEPEAQGRKSQDDPLVSLVQGLVTPSKTTVNASGEEQVEDISPTTLEAAKTLSRVASQKPKSIDKGRRYKRRKESKGKKVATSLDFQEEVNTGSIKVSTVSEQVSTGSTKRSIPSPDKGQREGKAPMIIEEAPKKLVEEEELNEQQKKRRAQVQFEAQHYTDEDWDLIRAKIEANAELSKSMLGSDLQGEDFAKKMVDLKFSQLKNLSFKEVKEEFDKLVKQVESFTPINFEATKASLKRFGEELQSKTSKRLKSDKAKDGDSEDSDEVSEQDDSVSGTKIPINPVPVAMKSPSIATYKIIKQGEKGVYQIVREDGTNIVYINFGAMLKDISRDDLTELDRIVMNRYGMDGPEDELEKIFWKYLKNMFEEPLSTDPIWSALDKMGYDVKTIDALALLEDEEKFSKIWIIESSYESDRWWTKCQKSSPKQCHGREKHNLTSGSISASFFTSIMPESHTVSIGRLYGEYLNRRSAARAAKQKDSEEFHPGLRGREKEVKSLRGRIFRLESIIQVISLKSGIEKEEGLKKFSPQIEDILESTSEDESDIKDDTSLKEDIGDVYCCDVIGMYRNQRQQDAISKMAKEDKKKIEFEIQRLYNHREARLNKIAKEDKQRKCIGHMNSSAHMKLAIGHCVSKKRKYVDVMRSLYIGLSITLNVPSMEKLANQKNVLNPLMIEKCKSVKPWIEDLKRPFNRIDRIFLSHDFGGVVEQFFGRFVGLADLITKDALDRHMIFGHVIVAHPTIRYGLGYGEGHMARQCTQPKRSRNAAWYKDKAMLADAQEAGQILDEEQFAFLVDPEVPHSETYLNDMENQSVHAMQDFEQTPVMDVTDNKITSYSNIIPYSQYLQETQQATVQDTTLQAQQDSMILSNNESVTIELERYKERVKTFEQRLNIDLSSREKMIDSQMDDMIKEKLALKEQVDSLEQNLSKQIKEKECLLQTFTVFKNESKEKENKYMENEIDLEKRIKELDNIIFKVGQSAQTVHMLTKPQVFYDNIHKQALGYQNPFYLKKAQRIKPTLYDGIVISAKHVAMHVIDDEETLILEEESRSKMSEKEKDPEAIKQNISHKPIDYEKLNRLSEDFGKRFTPQQELSAEQAFWLRISNPTIESSNIPPVKVEVPSELPKVSLVNASLKKLKFYLTQFDSVVKKRTTPDARTEGEWGFEHTKAVFNNEIIPFLKSLKDIFNVFDKDLLNEIMEVQTVFDQMDVVVQQYLVDKQCLKIAKKELLLENDRLLQQIMSQDVLLTMMNSMSLNDESVNMKRKRNESCGKCFSLDAELLKSQNAHNDLLKSYSQLKKHSQLQDKDTTICKLKEIIKSMREKSKEENVNYDYCKIKTKNVELENSVAKLLLENKCLCKEIDHVKQVFKDQFDSIKKTRVHTKEHSDSLIDKLNLKCGENEDLKAQIQD